VRPASSPLARCGALAAALALAACGTSPTTPPCPGDVQARFRLQATLVEGAACADAARIDPAPSLTAAVSFTGAGTSALCPERALAEPLAGTRSGDAVELTAAAQAIAVPGCGCAARVVERVTGTVERGAAGDAVRFTGELADEISSADGAATCAPSGTAPCPVPCRIRWSLQSVP
jgi:hypothetical protein